ncbi:MAG TPA: VWA domain-containing protein [Thermoanaerobaculia bacterium]|nr:VWA domain-containing protein [Thermoanaerobaculia bacterium]
MTFASPFWLLLALPLFARIALVVRDRRKRFGAFTVSSLNLVSPKLPFRARFAGLPFVLECVAALLMIIALARPQRITRLASNDRYGVDIVVALDASGSMAAEDFRPRNRFAVAKDLIGEFISKRQDDRIGIVTFGVRAATRVPITYDREIAQSILDKAQVGENGDGTAIGHAIATAVNRLRSSKTRSRIIILVTDGVNNAGSIEPMTAANIASKLGIKIYTIGVGSRGDSNGEVWYPIKRVDPLTGEMKNEYQKIRADLDEETLSNIAHTTGGEYFRATDAQTMSQILNRIDSLEKTKLMAPKSEKVNELYTGVLGAALGALALSLFSGETLWQKISA